MIADRHDNLRQILLAALLLGSFGLLGSGLLSLTQRVTAPLIQQNERATLGALLADLIPPQAYDNPITEDWIRVRDPVLLGSDEPITVYRAYHEGRPVAVFATPVAPDGYGGPIRLLVATRADGRLAGVRVLAHRETPGLGDVIEADRSDWIRGFAGRALGDPPLSAWALRRDGGAFDQFTGATITPRAVVRAVRDWLRYFEIHRERLFAPREST